MFIKINATATEPPKIKMVGRQSDAKENRMPVKNQYLNVLYLTLLAKKKSMKQISAGLKDSVIVK